MRSRRTESIRRLWEFTARRLSCAHRDERGTISIVTVFCLLMFTILLIMIVNVGRHLDDKMKRQNAADAAAYSGGIVLARGMNAIAFSNHLLADVFAITAFLREGDQRSAEQLTPETFEEWKKVGETFSTAEFEKFKTLGTAILDKVPREQRLLGAFGDMTEAASGFALPVFEAILREHYIPEFQRTVITGIPELAQGAASEIAFRHGRPNSALTTAAQQVAPSGRPARQRAGEPRPRGPQLGLLWRTLVEPVGQPDEGNPLVRTLPVVDTAEDGSDLFALPNALQRQQEAIEQRRQLAKWYLERWTSDKLRLFDTHAEMSQFDKLWRIITCARLERLLNEEYPRTNLPMLLRQPQTGSSPDTLAEGDRGNYLEREFHFVGAVYRDPLGEMGPGLFRNPLASQSDAVTFAQLSLFVPRPRRYLTYGGSGSPSQGLGGSFGFESGLNVPQPDEPGDPDYGPEDEKWPSENWPTHWDMLNQNWMVKLVPATAERLPEILESNPGGSLADMRPPQLGDATIREIIQVNTH